MPLNVPEDATNSVTAPPRTPFPILPHDTQPILPLPKALYVGTGGTVVLRGIDATADVILRNVASGQTLDIRASHVRATGTTASDIVALA